MTAPLGLHLVRCHGLPVAIVAAASRGSAVNIAARLDPGLPVGEMTTLHLGAAKEFAREVVADLRVDAGPGVQAQIVPVAPPKPITPQKRIAAGFVRGPEATAPAEGVAAFEAVCKMMDTNAVRVRESQAPLAAKIRRAFWLAMADHGGHSNRAIARITRHHDSTVSHAIIDERRRGNANRDDVFAKVYEHTKLLLERSPS